MDEYSPIACADYDLYEIAIMRRQQLEIVLLEEGEKTECLISPLGLRIDNRQEWLDYRKVGDDETKLNSVRLDKILSARLVTEK